MYLSLVIKNITTMAISDKVTKLSNLKKVVKTIDNSLAEEIRQLQDERAKEKERAQSSFNVALFEEVEEIRQSLFEQYNMGLISNKKYFAKLAETYGDAALECYDIIYS